MNFDHTKSEHIREELNKLKSRWDTFQTQVIESRNHIDLCVQYFTLINEVNDLIVNHFSKHIIYFVITGSRVVPRGK